MNPNMATTEEFIEVEKILLKLAWKYAQTYPVTFEEARAEAYYHFVKKAPKYRPGPTKFTTWIYFAVGMQLKTWVMGRAKDPHVFIEMNDDLCGEAPPEVSEALELVRELPGDARELVSLLCEAPRECLEGFRLLLHDSCAKWLPEEVDDPNVKKAVRFLKRRGKTVADLQELRAELDWAK